MTTKMVYTINPFFSDTRGSISSLIPVRETIQGVLFLTCKKNAIRANHYHKKDSHYSYIYKGKMEYLWKDLSKKNSKRKSVIVKAGEIIYTPPGVAHAMYFLEDTEFFAFTTRRRNKNDYETDTVKILLK